jgi:DNA recombination protein RmuC
MIPALLIAICALAVLANILLVFQRNKASEPDQALYGKLTELKAVFDQFQSALRDDLRLGRQESADVAAGTRKELNAAINDFRKELTDTLRNITSQSQETLNNINTTLAQKLEQQSKKIDENNELNRDKLHLSIREFTESLQQKFDELKAEQKNLRENTISQLDKITQKVEEKLGLLTEQSKNDNTQMREALIKAVADFQEAFRKNIELLNNEQRDKLQMLENRQKELVKNTEEKLEKIRESVEEKLTKTLSERLGQSFETVGKQLSEVQQGLGEMKVLATDVGGLKKVLNNVKLRGGVGEVQLAMLLEQTLAPNQYTANVITRPGSGESVEFAIKLPGRNDDENEYVYLPIDAKFPKDTYENFVNAIEKGDPDEINVSTKALEIRIKGMAKDIRDKYIEVPYTTDFAILFLPFEAVYAEVMRRSALVDQLSREFKVTVAGPSTLLALLNSLQMGFRTLAIQKRSSEVWNVLSKVKTEFEKFGGLLEKAQNNIQTGLKQLDEVTGTRTRAIERSLRNVQTLGESGLNQVEKAATELIDLNFEGE